MRLAEILKEKFDLALSMPLPEGEGIDRKEMAASDMLPYTFHYDDETVITKDDGLVQVIKLDGLYYESLSDEQIKHYERQRNTVLRAIANSDRGIYVHVVRRKINTYPAGHFKTWFARYLNDQWRKRCEARSFYINELYISVVRNRFRQGVPGVLDRIISLVTGNKIRQEELETFDDQRKDIYEASDLIVQTLADYGARRLRIQRTSDGDFSEIGRFLHYLVNLDDEPVPVTDLPLDKTLAISRLNFRTLGNTMEIAGVASRRAAAILSMNEWPERTTSRMLDDFLKLPIEFVITQSFYFIDRISAESDMKQQKRRMEQNKDIATDQIEDIGQGLRDLGAGRSVNGLHHLTILVHVPASPDGKQQTITNLEQAVGFLKKAFVNLGVKPVREYFAIETFFWSQLPGQAQHLIGRRGKIKSANFAGFASLHNFAVGKIDGNLWGPAIMPLETESGTAYNLNLHRETEGMVAGHTGITAETGAGKTTLLATIVAMADKAEPRVFWFDNRHGADVFMRAMGGQHTVLTVQGSTGWNPFQQPDTPMNRNYLVDLLSLMRTCYGGKLTPDDIERLKNTVHEHYAFESMKDRRLRNLAWCFGQGQLAKDMRVWHSDGANAGAFDNETDNIDLAKCRHYCYEMKELILETGARPELPIILSYPFHRIEQAMNGDPFILVLEEGQNLVKHPFWRDKIDSYLMQIRRKNGLLIFVTPDAKYLYKETDSLKKQLVTNIFMPTKKIDRVDHIDNLHLVEAEVKFLEETPPKSHKFLIRRGNESIRAIFDLSDISHVIPVLSSNDKGVRLMHEIMKELGTDEPETWVPVFMQRAIEQNTHNLQSQGVAA